MLTLLTPDLDSYIKQDQIEKLKMIKVLIEELIKEIEDEKGISNISS